MGWDPGAILHLETKTSSGPPGYPMGLNTNKAFSFVECSPLSVLIRYPIHFDIRREQLEPAMKTAPTLSYVSVGSHPI